MRVLRLLACSVALTVVALASGSVAAQGAEGSEGYWLAGADGGVFAFGDAPFLGSAAGLRLNQPVVGMAATPSGNGYWLAGADGGVFAFGDAPFLGSAADISLQEPIVGMAATPSGNGYWLAGADGGVFAFGDAPFLGVGGIRKCEAEDLRGGCALRRSLVIVSIAAPPDDVGYALLSITGGVWNFGSADAPWPPCPIESSGADPHLVGLHSNGCATGMAASPAGGFVVSWFDGFVQSSGLAPQCEKPGGVTLPRIVGIAVNRANDGCWLLGNDGGVFTLGNAPFLGSLANLRLNAPVVGIAAQPDG